MLVVDSTQGKIHKPIHMSQGEISSYGLKEKLRVPFNVRCSVLWESVTLISSAEILHAFFLATSSLMRRITSTGIAPSE
jgi:hypothetical protein